jgi:hypothetical protein
VQAKPITVHFLAKADAEARDAIASVVELSGWGKVDHDRQRGVLLISPNPSEVRALQAQLTELAEEGALVWSYAAT